MTMSLTLRSSSKKRHPIIQNGAKDNFHSHRKVMICGNTGIRQLGLDHCRAGIDTVMQDDQLFASFIVENISLAAHTVCIWRVARWGQVLNFVSAKHVEYVSLRSYTTIWVALLVERSCRRQTQDMALLSAACLMAEAAFGVGLTRALYRKPKLLVMDEATCHLDDECERIAVENTSMMDVAKIVISHRAGVVANADKVLYVKNSLMQIKNEI